MSKRNVAELEKKDIILFKGDWAALAAILRPRRITPTQFIRELVHRKLLQIQAASQDTFNHVETPDVLADTDLADLIQPGEPSQES